MKSKLLAAVIVALTVASIAILLRRPSNAAAVDLLPQTGQSENFDQAKAIADLTKAMAGKKNQPAF